ncbi:MAG: ATP-binding cassette domain-containing protein [Desulfobacteraceae bacterium]|nr:MAG: ATP-binding cassette domain-containing protein [Desulfobacteraceae bacterium]
MNNTAIHVENLGKLYKIGSTKESNKTFREAITDAVKVPWRSMKNVIFKQPVTNDKNNNYIWALKDVSFEVKRGEVVGVIGRNGAGKSTLLKILSRITEPTEGRIVLHGRVGSLLEVGTGFHSELTGEENIYLSGTILGMSSREISSKFDEIVSFAEMRKFINTPVKYYSSGMYMRLAFAVAAHLEPEILLVDEVLAVGDADFQKKCLGKMNDVANEGRTILFVSHNMAAVQSLCKKTILLESGSVVKSGDSKSVVSSYLSSSGRITSAMVWSDETAPGNEEITLKSMSAYSDDGNNSGVYQSRKKIIIETKFTTTNIHSALCVGFDLVSAQGETVLRSYQTDMPPEKWPKVKQGENIWRCMIPAGLLNAGHFDLCPRIGIHNMYWIVYLDSVAQFEVVLDHGVSPFWSSLDSRNHPGIIAPILTWEPMK